MPCSKSEELKNKLSEITINLVETFSASDSNWWQSTICCRFSHTCFFMCNEKYAFGICCFASLSQQVNDNWIIHRDSGLCSAFFSSSSSSSFIFDWVIYFHFGADAAINKSITITICLRSVFVGLDFADMMEASRASLGGDRRRQNRKQGLRFE